MRGVCSLVHGAEWAVSKLANRQRQRHCAEGPLATCNTVHIGFSPTNAATYVNISVWSVPHMGSNADIGHCPNMRLSLMHDLTHAEVTLVIDTLAAAAPT